MSDFRSHQTLNPLSQARLSTFETFLDKKATREAEVDQSLSVLSIVVTVVMAFKRMTFCFSVLVLVVGINLQLQQVESLNLMADLARKLHIGKEMSRGNKRAD